jgi:hypothetical protein
VQRAFMDANNGLLPIEKGIDVISVGTSFLRFLEVAEKLEKNAIVVTDNDGDVNALKLKYKKYLEAGINSIPVIVPNIHPYNRVIHDKQNGFMYGKPDDCTNEHFIPYLKDLLLNNFGLIKLCGGHAYEDVKKNFDYSKANIDIISKLL